MATTKQKEAARQNLKKARAAGTRKKAHAASSNGNQLSTADKNDLPTKKFAFPKERKEPLTDAKHVRNAIARFDQVEGVTDAERDKAWTRIKKAAKTYDIDVEATSWRELGRDGGTATSGSKAKARSTSKAKSTSKSTGKRKAKAKASGSKRKASSRSS